MKVKICGLTDVEDIQAVAELGTDFIGINFSKKSKRFVSIEKAKKLVEAAKECGLKVVGVFYKQEFDEIHKACLETNISMIQLHDVSEKVFDRLKDLYTVVYATHSNETKPLPDSDFIIFDNKEPGSGKIQNFKKITLPENRSCFLAGGLNPENISDAIQYVSPYGVDVATGVELPNSTRKDMQRVESFIAQAKKNSFSFKFGGQFVPELLVAPIKELEDKWIKLKKDPSFQEELSTILKTFVGRETPITEVKNFSKAINGPRVFLKREDLLHTGAHKINNAIGQCLIAKYLGKKRIIAETGAGQHGVAVATACAYFGLECVVYMGDVDIQRQKPNVDKMKLLGAQVISVTEGAATLKNAVNEALRDWAQTYEHSHYCLGSAVGPHPFPSIVREFQSVISFELKKQLQEVKIEKPDLLIACVGGGSNAIGFFHHFIEDETVQLVGVEAGGKGKKTGEHASRFLSGKTGVFHGFYSYFLQDSFGQIAPTHSISAGLDYPGIGPDHAILHDADRAKYESVSDDEAVAAFHVLAKTEGIIPALESSHALGYLIKIAPTLDKESVVVVNLSGRGDKDLGQIAKYVGKNNESN